MTSPEQRARRVVPVVVYHYRGHVGRAEADARLRRAIAKEIRAAVSTALLERDAALARVAELEAER